ncbi:hypothetical protein GPA19_20940 [Azoarcus indigens]|uniref:hypothetical protein n=1 Tax=Azoarcus indigens TaxID=29545 RepID=UPI0010607D68|nr:hypothetical protein [Azoarcus indigens]NMG67412.1 hypothetical protein [Azoarcus indigens]
MSSIRKKLILVAAGVIWIIPGVSARALELQGVVAPVSYDETPRSAYSAPSLLAGEVAFHSAKNLGSTTTIREAAALPPVVMVNSLVMDPSQGGGGVLSISRSLEGEASTFADRVALRFSLADGEEAETGISPLLLSALGLFALIARRRLIAR